MFALSRAVGLDRLAAFLPHAGRDHAALPDLDPPSHPHLSTLGSLLRHRLLAETEVIDAALRVHPRGAGTFLAGSASGHLGRCRQGLAAVLNLLAVESGLAARSEATMRGEAGIDVLDHQAQDLVATGSLHNHHARTWFATVWNVTLRMPRDLGADVFLRHLIDDDPASSTLSWHWVGGVQAPGKTYLATLENIALTTRGRFRPEAFAPRPLPWTRRRQACFWSPNRTFRPNSCRITACASVPSPS